MAHDRNIEIHAWVWTFAAGNTRHNAILNQPATYPGPLIAAHPDWANYDNQGRMIPQGQTKPFLDPANPAVRRYLLSLFEEIVTRYDVDGLQLDYIRYPFQDVEAGRTYGYGSAARAQFSQRTGVDPLTLSPSDRQRWEQWTAFRTEQIDSFVAETAALLDQVNPDLLLSTAVFPMPTHQRRQEIQQAWETWAQRGDVDLIVLMSYAMDTNQFQRMTSPWLSNINVGSALILPSIRLLELSEYAAIDQLQASRDLSSGGYALFAAADLRSPFEGMLQRTQGTRSPRQTNNQPIPYRQPFEAAADRFIALEREWSFLLTTEQLEIPTNLLREWSDQSETVREALEALADRPTSQRLAHANQVLTQFRQRFGRWTAPYASENEYRVQTWSNRLTTLDQLLTYGEQQVLRQGNERVIRPPGSRQQN
ncbi:MAG: family 10 glycosylhydrolase [Leptolyngbyaceae cyanobacterium SL_7_1]|nr:family 10 glycosylhydrolase [Leptolyngbyaceae cyanobacterium SL_7_1]